MKMLLGNQEHFSIQVINTQWIYCYKNIMTIPDNYDEVRDDFVKALIEFYEMKSPKE